MNSLKQVAVDLLSQLPRYVRTCDSKYSVALALADDGLVVLRGRTILGNGQIRYFVERTKGQRP
jgi:hypothetical protein